MSEGNVEIIRRVWDLWEKEGPDQGSLGAAWDHGLAASDATIRPLLVPDSQTYVGRDGWMEFNRAWAEGFLDWTIHAERIIDAGGDHVAVVALQSATGKESGVPVEARFGIVYTIENAQITDMAMQTVDEALEAAGLSE